MPDLAHYPLALNLAIFVAAAIAVWIAGSRVVGYVDAIADKTGLGQAFAGMLMLGGITSLPEIAAIATASGMGNARLSIGNLLGSVTMNLVLLGIADAASFSTKALTSVVPGPATMLQGTLSIVALALFAGIAGAGDVPVGGVGFGSFLLFAFVVFAFWLAARYAKHSPWRADRSTTRRKRRQRQTQAAPAVSDLERESLLRLWAVTAGFSLVIVVAGFVLSKSADAISAKTGLGSSFVGLVLVGFATSLPEFSSIVAAVRLERFEMAISDVFGSNLFVLGLVLLADAVFAGGPVLNQGGRFEIVAALLGIVMTAIYLIGLLEREDRTIFGLGYDSLAVFGVYLAGLVLLYRLA